MKTAPDTTPSGAPASKPELEQDAEKWLRCVRCDARVVRDAARISVNGAHEHGFMNPSGLRFVVGCWSSAPGCVPSGARETVWTWFPGYAWQIESCRSCAAHLGWSFHGASPETASFYGLIKDRLA
jgi:hypothetical protein